MLSDIYCFICWSEYETNTAGNTTQKNKKCMIRIYQTTVKIIYYDLSIDLAPIHPHLLGGFTYDIHVSH